MLSIPCYFDYPGGAGKSSSKSGKHKWVPLDIDVKASRPGKHGPPHAARQENGMIEGTGCIPQFHPRLDDEK